MAAPAPPRRERRRLELRRRILDAAVELFETQGYGATRVAEICERADVAHKTFFNHFGSKRDLLREVAGESLSQLLLDLEEARKAPLPLRGRIAFFFERVADNAEQAGPMHRELLTELVHVANEPGTGSEQARALQTAFRALVGEGPGAGEAGPEHAVETRAELVLGAFYALMFNWANLEAYPLRRRAREAARLLGDALCGGPEGDAA
jgi:AcrR family transcriptional regulator